MEFCFDGKLCTRHSEKQSATGCGYRFHNSCDKQGEGLDYCEELHSLLASQFTIRKELWFLPGYYIGISPKGKTIDELVYERAWRSYALIFVLNLVIMVGVWVVFKNIKKALELVRLKSDFVSNVSHELRTPLALISMFSETLELGRVRNDSKRQEYYKIISQEASGFRKLLTGY